MNRRGFLVGVAGLVAAPAVVRAESLMRVRPLDGYSRIGRLLVPDPPDVFKAPYGRVTVGGFEVGALMSVSCFVELVRSVEQDVAEQMRLEFVELRQGEVGRR